MAEGTNIQLKNKIKTTLRDKSNSSSEIMCDSCLPILCPNSENTADKIKPADMSYACGICNKCFRDQQSLRKHEFHHKRQPVECPHCHKFFSLPVYLKIHMRVHTGERPYTCKQCGKSFRHSSTLGRHRRVHTGERPFTCPIEDCEHSFKRKQDLNYHLMVHRGEKPHQCAECLKRFRSPSNLKRHHLYCRPKIYPTAGKSISRTQSEDDQLPSCSFKQRSEKVLDYNKPMQVSSCKNEECNVNSSPKRISSPLLTSNYIHREIPRCTNAIKVTRNTSNYPEQVEESIDRWKDHSIRSILGLKQCEMILDKESMQTQPIDLSLSHSGTSNFTQ